MFWFHFYAATQRGTLSTERAREKTVDDLELDSLTDDEAVRLLELANEGVYDTGDMPEQWQGVFEEMEENLHP